MEAISLGSWAFFSKKTLPLSISIRQQDALDTERADTCQGKRRRMKISKIVFFKNHHLTNYMKGKKELVHLIQKKKKISLPFLNKRIFIFSTGKQNSRRKGSCPFPLIFQLTARVDLHP